MPQQPPRLPTPLDLARARPRPAQPPPPRSRRQAEKEKDRVHQELRALLADPALGARARDAGRGRIRVLVNFRTPRQAAAWGDAVYGRLMA
jgi:hypothetical protein